MKSFIILIFISSFYFAYSQQKVFFVDTIKLNSPVVLSIPINNKDSSEKISIVIEREKVKSLFELNLKYFDEIISIDGYVFINPHHYSIIITTIKNGNLSKSDSLLYTKIFKDLRNKTKEPAIFVPFDRENPKYLYGFEYYEIYPREFYNFVIIGDYIQKKINVYESNFIQYKRLYLPVLFPYQ